MNAANDSVGIWKATALILAGIVISLVGCVYSQDRDRATKADLAPIAKSVQDTQEKFGEMNNHLSFLEGQLHAKKLIEP